MVKPISFHERKLIGDLFFFKKKKKKVTQRVSGDELDDVYNGVYDKRRIKRDHYFRGESGEPRKSTTVESVEL